MDKKLEFACANSRIRRWNSVASRGSEVGSLRPLCTLALARISRAVVGDRADLYTLTNPRVCKFGEGGGLEVRDFRRLEGNLYTERLSWPQSMDHTPGERSLDLTVEGPGTSQTVKRFSIPGSQLLNERPPIGFTAPGKMEGS